LLPIYSQVVKDEGDYHDKRRLFYSSIMNDNLIDSIIEKANVRYIKPKVWQTSVKIFLSICLKFHLMKDCSSVNFEVYISVFICNNCWFFFLCVTFCRLVWSWLLFYHLTSIMIWNIVLITLRSAKYQQVCHGVV
jgi:hypothetical protein